MYNKKSLIPFFSSDSQCLLIGEFRPFEFRGIVNWCGIITGITARLSFVFFILFSFLWLNRGDCTVPGHFFIGSKRTEEGAEVPQHRSFPQCHENSTWFQGLHLVYTHCRTCDLPRKISLQSCFLFLVILFHKSLSAYSLR